jgi:hypothetical protein
VSSSRPTDFLQQKPFVGSARGYLSSASTIAGKKPMPKSRKARVARARKEDNPDPGDLYADGLELSRRIQRLALDELADIIESQKNRQFVQFYSAGFALLDLLLRDPQTVMAGRLFVLLAEHANRQNTLLATQKQIAEILEVHPKTIQRASKTLESLNALKRIQVPGSGFAYCLSPAMIWSGKNDEKPFCPFKTGRLAKRRSDDPTGPATFDFRTFAVKPEKQEPKAERAETPEPATTTSNPDQSPSGAAICDEEDIYASDADIGLEP